MDGKRKISTEIAEDRMFLRLRVKITAIATSLVFLVLLVVFVTLYMNEYSSKLNFIQMELDRAITEVAETHTAESVHGIVVEGRPNAFIIEDEHALRIQDLMKRKNFYQKNENIVYGEDSLSENGAESSSEENENKTQLGIASDFKSETYIPIIVYYIDYENTKLVPAENQNVTLTQESLDSAERQLIASEYSFSRDSASGLCYLKKGTQVGDMIAFTDVTSVESYMDNFSRTFSMLMLLAILVLGILAWLASTLVVKPIRKTWDDQRRFIADASHELKTPVAVITANCSIVLEDDNISPETRRWTQTTLEEAESMKNLINDMLYLSTSSMGGDGVSETLDLSKEVMRVAMQFEARAFECGNTIDYMDTEDDLMVSVDKQNLQRIVTILIDNACKYSYDDTEITLRTYTSKKTAVLEVADYGESIPPDAENEVFDRFFRMDKSRTRANGYGLGLAMAKDLVEKHNGKISAKTCEDNKTVFTVTFPKLQNKKSKADN